MEERNIGILEFFNNLRKVKKLDNFNFSLMSREEKIEFLVIEMEKIEKKYPEMVVFIENDFTDNRER